VKVLLDTCVLSELRRPGANPRVLEAVDALDADRLFLSAITIGELTKGIALLDEGRRKRDLQSWLLDLEQHFADQILAVDAEVAQLWGVLTARAQQRGTQIPASDGLIAATALRHGLTVLTRNTAHFAASGAFVVDPWNE
jgi:predicted nucleic acid-binding protein